MDLSVIIGIVVLAVVLFSFISMFGIDLVLWVVSDWRVTLAVLFVLGALAAVAAYVLLDAPRSWIRFTER